MACRRELPLTGQIDAPRLKLKRQLAKCLQEARNWMRRSAFCLCMLAEVWQAVETRADGTQRRRMRKQGTPFCSHSRLFCTILVFVHGFCRGIKGFVVNSPFCQEYAVIP